MSFFLNETIWKISDWNEKKSACDADSGTPHAFLVFSEFPVFPLTLAVRAAFFINLCGILFCKTNIIFMGKRDYYSLYMPFPYFY